MSDCLYSFFSSYSSGSFLFPFSLIPSSYTFYVFSLGVKCVSFSTHFGFPFCLGFVKFFLFLAFGFACGSFFGLALLVFIFGGSFMFSFVNLWVVSFLGRLSVHISLHSQGKSFSFLSFFREDIFT